MRYVISVLSFSSSGLGLLVVLNIKSYFACTVEGTA